MWDLWAPGTGLDPAVLLTCWGGEAGNVVSGHAQGWGTHFFQAHGRCLGDLSPVTQRNGVPKVSNPVVPKRAS